MKEDDEGESKMNIYYEMPSDEMDFWKINDNSHLISIKWTRNLSGDYQKMAEEFFRCGYSIFNEVIESGHDNIKSDMWFLPGIFMLRQSIELLLKSLICRVHMHKPEIQADLVECKHNLYELYKRYEKKESFLSNEEHSWLMQYLFSLEEVDEKSDVFRFPFEDDFLSQYRDKFLDNVDVANNMLQAYALVKKCFNKGVFDAGDTFYSEFKPHFLIFANHGIGNCYLWQAPSDDGFHAKVVGYLESIDYLYNDDSLDINTKFYPLMFMYRNTIELCLKRYFYKRIDDGIPEKIFWSKRKSHLLKKDLWKYVKPLIERYTESINDSDDMIKIVEKQIMFISLIDKNGDTFRYPTSYSLEYKFDDVVLDYDNAYCYYRSLINFLDGVDTLIENDIELQNELRTEYEAELRAEMDSYY